MILWTESGKETGIRESRWKIPDLLADESCGQAVLDFLFTTDVGRLIVCFVPEASGFCL